MEGKRSPRRGTRPPAQRTGPKTIQDRLTLTNAASIGKSAPRAKFDDTWLAERIRHYDAESNRLKAGQVAKKFLSKAKAQYRQYCRFGLAKYRHLSWSHLAQVAAQLVRHAVRSSETLHRQEVL